MIVLNASVSHTMLLKIPYQKIFKHSAIFLVASCLLSGAKFVFLKLEEILNSVFVSNGQWLNTRTPRNKTEPACKTMGTPQSKNS